MSKKPAAAPKTFVKHARAMMLQARALESMHPAFRARVTSVLNHLINKGWQPFVFQGKTRTRAQAARNAKAGTGIVMSWHRPEVHGRFRDQIVELYAADIVDERWGWEGPAKDLSHPFWKDLGEYAKAEALEWGGDWEREDVAHVQMALMDAAPSRSAIV